MPGGDRRHLDLRPEGGARARRRHRLARQTRSDHLRPRNRVHLQRYARLGSKQSDRLAFIAPGKPMQNGICEAFNGRLRAECLNAHWFLTLALADGQALLAVKPLRFLSIQNVAITPSRRRAAVISSRCTAVSLVDIARPFVGARQSGLLTDASLGSASADEAEGLRAASLNRQRPHASSPSSRRPVLSQRSPDAVNEGL